MLQFAFLFAAGLIAGAMNGLAGGGSFVSLPALIAAGVPPVQANASSTVALYPGGIATTWTYYDKPGTVCGMGMASLLPVTLAGGLAGSLLLLWTPPGVFTMVLPWLLLLATLALAFGRAIALALRGRLNPRPAVMLAAHFSLGLYGGYFGGAVGLMILAFWALLGQSDIKVLNGPRAMLVSAANTMAVVVFSFSGAVYWAQTLVVLVGGIFGGYFGAKLGRIMPARVTRALTLLISAAITAVFFVKTYWLAG